MNRLRSEAELAAFVMGNKHGEEMRSVESQGDEEDDRGEHQGNDPSDVTDGNEPFDTRVFRGDGID